MGTLLNYQHRAVNQVSAPPSPPSRLLTSPLLVKHMSVGCFGRLGALLQDCPLVCSSFCPSTVVKIDALCSVNDADKSNPRVIPCLLLSLFVCLPQENDLNNMLNSLYDLPVPKPFTPVNLSVVGTHTTRSSGREAGPA